MACWCALAGIENAQMPVRNVKVKSNVWIRLIKESCTSAHHGYCQIDCSHILILFIKTTLPVLK
jgi:hypothetical protein